MLNARTQNDQKCQIDRRRLRRTTPYCHNVIVRGDVRRTVLYSRNFRLKCDIVL